MYKYINPKGKFIAEYLELGGKELVYEVLKMIPKDYKARVVNLGRAIKEFDYPAIQMEVHTIKANFRQIVEVDHEFMIFIQKFEDDSRILSEKTEKNIAITHAVDFSEYFKRFKKESDLVAQEIDHFADSLE
jgi:Mg2+ and Co2+ transporter CorA